MKKYVEPHLKYMLGDLAILKQRLPQSKDKFMADGVLQDAMLMRLIDVGEQLIHIREKFPEFYQINENETWHKLIGLRNIIAHGYHEVDNDTIWNIVAAKLDGLEDQLQTLLKG